MVLKSPRNLLLARRREETGAVAVVVALMMVVLVMFAALVVDIGMAKDSRRQAQNASDAAALAAGNSIVNGGTWTAAIAVAKSYALTNYEVAASAWTGCVDPNHLAVVAPGTECISTDNATNPGKIRVATPTKAVQTVFGGFTGKSSINVAAQAEISLDAGGRSACGLCVIGPGQHDLQNGTITVTQSGVTVNGTIVANPQGTIAITTTGSDQIIFQGPIPTKGTYTPAPLANQPPIADPLAGLVLPPDMTSLSVKTDPCTQGPGRYGAVSLAGSGPCVMSPGLYVFTGEFDIKNRDVTALLSTMYFTCGTAAAPTECAVGQDGGYIKQAGNGDFKFTAPTSGPTAGLAIIASRNNDATFTYRGTATETSTGTIYIKSGTLDFRGTSGSTKLDSLVVTGNITFSGQAPVDIRYTENLNAAVAPTNLRLTR